MSLVVSRLELGGGVVHRLAVDRPAVRNALDTATLAALVDALDDASGDDAARGLLLASHGGHFSAGADLGEGGTDPVGSARRRELFVHVYEVLSTFPLPTAAAVEGVAVGGGLELAVACDLLVVARGARLRFPGAQHGVPVGVARTVGRVGVSTAKDWVLSSRWVDPVEAHRTGLAQRLVDDGGAEEAAAAWLGQVAERDAPTVRYLKGAFTDLGGVRDRVARENDALRAQGALGRLPDDVDPPRTVRPRRGG